MMYAHVSAYLGLSSTHSTQTGSEEDFSCKRIQSKVFPTGIQNGQLKIEKKLES